MPFDRNAPLPGQGKVERFYNSNHIQIAVAVLIGANFLTNIIEKEVDPYGTEHKDTFGAFELFYNICFTVELAVNMYAHWCKKFWASKWNIFDVTVVTIGIINTMNLPLPKAFSLLRMMRAFRVFRLFKRVHSLNKIIVAIAHAVPGVVNAFLILAIVMSIYAILAVEFYFEIGEGCDRPGGDVRWRTFRGGCTGQEYWGTFTKSLYTFFQVLTGESWSEAVARPAIWYFYDDPIRAVGSGLFFVSYVIITAFVLTNVVVAVLLDKMVDPVVADDAHARGAEEVDEGDENSCPNGEESKADPTPDDLHFAIDSVSDQVEKLMAVQDRMSSEIDTFKTDMTSMREQVRRMI